MSTGEVGNEPGNDNVCTANDPVDPNKGISRRTHSSDLRLWVTASLAHQF